MRRLTEKPDITAELVARGFITERQTAEMLRTTVGYLRQMRHLGRGPRFYKIVRDTFYREKDIDDWLAAQAREPGRQRAA
jgi:hypothetical protein